MTSHRIRKDLRRLKHAQVSKFEVTHVLSSACVVVETEAVQNSVITDLSVCFTFRSYRHCPSSSVIRTFYQHHGWNMAMDVVNMWLVFDC